MTFLLNTDTVIFLIRGLKIQDVRNPRQLALQKMGTQVFHRARQHALEGNDIVLSAITVAELAFGARHSGDYENEKAILQRVLTPFTLLDIDATACAQSYGEIQQSLESSGKSIGSLDTLIAAHALAVRAVLVTNNTAEFKRVAGLTLENWTE